MAGVNAMPRFDKNSAEGLRKLIYNSYAHDAKLESVEYKCAEDELKIKLFNPIFNIKLDLDFHGVETVFAVKGKEYGSRDTLISLTVEVDFSYLQTYLKNSSTCSEDCLYMLFQMFSGGELHVVAKEVAVLIDRSVI